MRAFKTLEWIGDIDGYLELTDQRILPGEFNKLKCQTVEQLYDAIKTLAVRGAPAIGVSAAFGVCIAAKEIANTATCKTALGHLEKRIDFLARSRPTAVNLFWALQRMRAAAQGFLKESSRATVTELRKALLAEAQKICREDVEMCEKIGINGQQFISEGASILTHCNAGALATAGTGTALAPMFEAQKRGRNFKVYVDETRPLMQGARLTAWELVRCGIDATLICDNMAGWLMKTGRIDAVITGADRIAANGDAANKIGTYALSILAKAHNIPFYIAAPSSTFDLEIKDGKSIPIEQRDSEEITTFGGKQTAPAGVKVCNPAFDVTEAENITAIITEKAVISAPNAKKIAMAMQF